MRVSVATICPALWRNRWSTVPWVSVISLLDGADLDRPEVEVRRVLALPDRLVVVVRVHHEEAADDLLRLGIRSVGDRHSAVLAKHDAALAVAELVPLPGDAVDPGAVAQHDRLNLLGAEALRIPIGVAKHDQKLRHDILLS